MKRIFSIIIIFFCILFSAFGQEVKHSIQELNPKEKLVYTQYISNKTDIKKYYFSLFITNNWNYTYKRNAIHCYIYKEDDSKFENVCSVFSDKYFKELEKKVKTEETIYTTSFFSLYDKSKFYEQLNLFKVEDCLTYIVDLDNDGTDEILSFGDANINAPKGLMITKYINNKWTCVFSEPYFGFYDWNGGFYLENKLDESAFSEGWLRPKPFPYDFVEYKGKIGLRIVCYDNPIYDPTHYHAQFWAYDENTKKYEMLEEIWEEEDFTSPDGLIFAESRENLFFE